MVYDQTPIATALADGDRPRSNEIFPLVRQALADASVAITDLAAIVVTIGPGSFTGLRVGYGCAAGMADAMGLPLLGIPTLTAMAVGADLRHGTIAPLLKARKNELYAALFAAGEATRHGSPPISPRLPTSWPLVWKGRSPSSAMVSIPRGRWPPRGGILPISAPPPIVPPLSAPPGSPRRLSPKGKRPTIRPTWSTSVVPKPS